MEDNNNNLVYFLVGAAVGAGVALLFAPQSGKETREMIRDRANEGADYVKRQSRDLRENAGDYVDKGKELLSRQRDQLSAAVQAGKQAYRDTVQTQPRSSDMEELGI
jgi:gas vesicle protein